MIQRICGLPSYRPTDGECRNVVVLSYGRRGDVARASLLNQIRVHHEQRSFTNWERAVKRTQIVQSLVAAMRMAIKHCGDEQVASLDDDHAKWLYLSAMNGLKLMEHPREDTFKALAALWRRRAIRDVFSDRRDEFIELRLPRFVVEECLEMLQTVTSG